MKLILTSNMLADPAYPKFIKAALKAHPGAGVLAAGDLLNVFPEPGENLMASMFAEIYGDIIVPELDHLVKTHFSSLEQSRLIEPLQQIFTPLGEYYADACDMAAKRYQDFFDTLLPALGDHTFYFIPGNMDYPYQARHYVEGKNNYCFLDCEQVRLNGTRLGGIGGIPNTAHPFKGIVEISPYEMSEAEYQRRLKLMWGVDVLITHLSPEEFPPLLDFVEQSPLKLLICRAPFNFRAASDFRGKSEVQQLGDKAIIKVRPFDIPTNHAFVIDIERGVFDSAAVEVFSYTV